MPCPTKDTSTSAYEHGGYIVLSLFYPTLAGWPRQALLKRHA